MTACPQSSQVFLPLPFQGILLSFQPISLTIQFIRSSPLKFYQLVRFSSAAQLCWLWLFATPWTVACQASLSITNSWACSNSCPSSRWCHPTISSSVIPFSSCLWSFPASVFSSELVLPSRWSKDWSFSFSVSISPFNEQSGMISFRTDWFDLLAVQGTHTITIEHDHQFSSVQSLSHVRLFVTPWTAAHQASLSITNSWSLLKLISIELVIPSNHLSSPSPPAFDFSQHQGLFQWFSSLHQVTKVLEFQLQHQSCWWIFRTDFL